MCRTRVAIISSLCKSFKAVHDLWYLLLDREKHALEELMAVYKTQFGADPAQDPDLCIYLGDNPQWSRTWSAASRRIPTFRCNAGLVWSPHFKRWMLPIEKLASQGLPVERSYADAMAVLPLPVRDTHRANTLIGNNMNMSSVAIVQLVALSCLGYK